MNLEIEEMKEQEAQVAAASSSQSEQAAVAASLRELRTSRRGAYIDRLSTNLVCDMIGADDMFPSFLQSMKIEVKVDNELVDCYNVPSELFRSLAASLESILNGTMATSITVTASTR